MAALEDAVPAIAVPKAHPKSISKSSSPTASISITRPTSSSAACATWIPARAASLRRLYNAVRRATRAAENERQHEFVMLRARLAYTIARHACAASTRSSACCCRSPARTKARATNASAICSKPSLLITNRA